MKSIERRVAMTDWAGQPAMDVMVTHKKYMVNDGS